MLPTLRKGDNTHGSTGSAVYMLQRCLTSLNRQTTGTPYLDSGDVDGIFGDHTKTAVSQFQMDNSVIDDVGIVGPPTWRSLADKLSPLNLNSMPIDSTQITDMATVITSEMSVGTQDEQVAVAYTLINRLRSSGQSNVRDVWGAYAHDQTPTQTFKDLASNIQSGGFLTNDDNNAGSTFFYSPRSMPKEGESTSGFDVGGGLEGPIAPLTVRNYKPSWTLTKIYVPISNVREAWCKCYR